MCDLQNSLFGRRVAEHKAVLRRPLKVFDCVKVTVLNGTRIDGLRPTHKDLAVPIALVQNRLLWQRQRGFFSIINVDSCTYRSGSRLHKQTECTNRKLHSLTTVLYHGPL